MRDFYEKLRSCVKKGIVREHEDMKAHTTFRAGGAAAFYAAPGELEELRAVIRLCGEENMPYFILGNGSNLLVSDGGYDGVMVDMTEGFKFCTVSGRTVTAGAGTPLARIAREALSHSLSGFEFAAGIPGTLGGALVMNAGAYGRELKDVLARARVLTPAGEVKELSGRELELGYRTSCILAMGYVALEADIMLEPGEQEAVRQRMDELALKRRTKQPLDYPSAGSTFKRPEGNFAGKLIEEAGLKGFRCGGAQVSEKHCGFVINRDHATAGDIWELCQAVKRKVKETSGVELELEVKTLGRF